MTDAKVTINGRKAGNGLHQGGFYRFTYDVSDRIFFGKHKNRLEVEVSKESSNSQVNMAERRADYWNFGGIFRPVFIVAKPAQNIDRVAIKSFLTIGESRQKSISLLCPHAVQPSTQYFHPKLPFG